MEISEEDSGFLEKKVVLKNHSHQKKIKINNEDKWKSGYKNSFKTIEEISGFLDINQENKSILCRVASFYPIRIPRYYFSLIQDLFDPADPIRKQCIPSQEEIELNSLESIDPLGEEKMSPLACLVHRYPDRVLLLVTGRCFMYCRHCTRKRLWNANKTDITSAELEQSVQYVKRNKKIREVIISGGDPLTLPAEKLDFILAAISAVENIEVIRIGTRAPVVFPQRIDNKLYAVLKKYNNLWVNVQFNHPREITKEAISACNKIQLCGIPVSNQSVLLKGINDSLEVMADLCKKLQSIKVRPYYLFECDPVVGAWHFRTAVEKGVSIIKEMRGYTSGMCVPTFVVDGIDGKGKVPLAPEYKVFSSKEGLLLKNYKDEIFFYPSPECNKIKAYPKIKKSRVKTIGIIFNLKVNPCGDEQEEYDEAETINSLKKVIENKGFEVKLFEQSNNLAEKLQKERPDFVVNIAEGLGLSRSRESQVPALLESMDIPYSGSDPVSLGITLDKFLAGKVLKSAFIPVPPSFMVEDEAQLQDLGYLFKEGKTFIVKPRWEGSSKGIFLNSLVNNFSDLKRQVKYIFSKYKQPALVEEFLQGEEITVGVGGNGKARVLGMMKIEAKNKLQKKFLYSQEIKRDWENKVIYKGEDSLPESLRKQLQEYALAAYKALELKDFARMDFRIDENNIPKIIDINPLPGLSARYSDLVILYRLKGKTYSDLVEELLKNAFERYQLKWPAG